MKNNNLKSSNIKTKNKKVLYIILSVLVIIVSILAYQYFFGCFKVPISSQYKSDRQLSNELVSVDIKKGSLTKEGMTIVLTNNSDYEISYGYGSSSLEIEYSMFNKWFMMLPKRNISTLAMGKIVKPKESVEITYDWKDKYGTLSSGNYRAVIDISISDKNDLTIAEQYKDSYVTYEFEI